MPASRSDTTDMGGRASVSEDPSEPASVTPPATGGTPAGPGGDGTGIRTFLIADVRGYTLFTHERGDEAAAKLAAKFASLAREGVEGRGGSVIELRGDEALAVFASPRQALRAAVELQARFVEETLADPALPLGVGIGLDAGEAVAVEGGYRGGALNLAARLCGLAGPGEVLASQEVTHLARRVERIGYVDRGPVHLKGLAEPVRVIRVIPEGEDPAQRLAARPARPAAHPPARGLRALPARLGLSGWRLAAAGLAVVVLAATALVAVRSADRGPTVAAIEANRTQYPPSPAELTFGIRCGSFVPNSGDNENTAQYCSRALEAKIERALRLQATDPVQAGPAWAAVDRQIVDQAPAVPLLVPQGIDLVSRRVGNYQHNPAWGIILSQLWVV
jgi:class 3 adenylate cyclase